MEKDKEIMILKDQNLTIQIGYVKVLHKKKYIEKDDINYLLDRMPPGKDKMMIQTMWMTGIRVTELINIRKRDIDFTNKTMSVRWLKNRKWNERIIPVHKHLLQMLNMYTAGLKADDLAFGITRQRVYQIVKKWFKTHPHTLRHSFAINFLRQNSSPWGARILQKLLGHSNVNTTMTYLDIVPADMALELNNISFG